MENYAIDLVGVSKCYQVYDRPVDRLKEALLARLARGLKTGYMPYFKEFWALRNVSLSVGRGEAVGIIGENGSGKSTLLQIICGTLSPTGGESRTEGRVAALLELGAGFNPEFTGIENIYMSASILGLSREEVDARFESIVAFADIGEFIDQPVKAYSSGMYVRLAFAVIAHVDAEILIVDEALAVGDAIFVQKCMRFLREFQRRGTLLFVSHDMGSVTNFCQRAIWLDRGRVREQGDAQDVIRAYQRHCNQKVYGDEFQIESIEAVTIAEPAPFSPSLQAQGEELRLEIFENIGASSAWTTGYGKIRSIRFENFAGAEGGSFSGGERVRLRVTAEAYAPLASPILGFFLKDRLGQSLFGEHTFNYVNPPLAVEPGDVLEAEFTFTLPLLPNGDYALTVSIADGDPYSNVQHHWIHDAVLIKVSSPRLRYGLVGIPFENVEMRRVRPS